MVVGTEASTSSHELLATVREYLPDDQALLIQSAYEYADQCHQGQTRMSGEPFMDHPLHTALALADLRLDADTLTAALLHDVMEDCGVSYQQLQDNFGNEVARLVDGVTKLTRLDTDKAGRAFSEDRLYD